MTQKLPIQPVDRSRFDEAVEVLCDAFFDYPVMRFIIGDIEGQDEREYLRRLTHLISFFTVARFLRDDLVLAVVEDRRFVAMANINLPGEAQLLDSRLGGGTPWTPQPIPELEEHRAALWGELGEAARERYEAYGAATADFEWPEPHFHLGMIGVLRSHTGRGLGRRLLDHLHQMSGSHPASLGVSLTTETASNVPFYRHFGYEIVGHERVGDLESWGFFRRDPG